MRHPVRQAILALGTVLALAMGILAGQDALVPAAGGAAAQPALLQVKRLYVDKFGGGATAPQIRDMIINALDAAGLFRITENEARADAVLRGSAEDLVFTDVHQVSDGITARLSLNTNNPIDKSTESGRDSRATGASVGQNESQRTEERRHEANAAVRILNKDGEVIWSTTQESQGAKFHGASADVAQKIARQLMLDYQRAKRAEAAPLPARKQMAPPSP